MKDYLAFVSVSSMLSSFHADAKAKWTDSMEWEESDSDDHILPSHSPLWQYQKIYNFVCANTHVIIVRETNVSHSCQMTKNWRETFVDCSLIFYSLPKCRMSKRWNDVMRMEEWTSKRRAENTRIVNDSARISNVPFDSLALSLLFLFGANTQRKHTRFHYKIFLVHISTRSQNGKRVRTGMRIRSSRPSRITVSLFAMWANISLYALSLFSFLYFSFSRSVLLMSTSSVPLHRSKNERLLRIAISSFFLYYLLRISLC